jgi:hypothetical protein
LVSILEVPLHKTRKPLYNKDLRVFSFPEGAPGGARQGQKVFFLYRYTTLFLGEIGLFWVDFV